MHPCIALAVVLALVAAPKASFGGDVATQADAAQATRALADAFFAARFELRQFHDRVLENGAITLPMLEQNINRWLGTVGGR